MTRKSASAGGRRYRPSFWLDPRLEIRVSPFGGKGSFATAPIASGEVVTIWGAEVFSEAEIDRGLARGRETLHLPDGTVLAYELYDFEAADHFLNHACDPNVWLDDEVTLTARRDIGAGEELTADYALWERVEDWEAPWRCGCDSPLCRGRITGKDWRLPELQERYRGHFLPEIERKIERLSSERQTSERGSG